MLEYVYLKAENTAQRIQQLSLVSIVHPQAEPRCFTAIASPIFPEAAYVAKHLAIYLMLYIPMNY